jgi:diguanylate cyclase (GGDEF)-like protein
MKTGTYPHKTFGLRYASSSREFLTSHDVLRAQIGFSTMTSPLTFNSYSDISETLFGTGKKRTIIQLRWIVILASCGLLASTDDIPGAPLVYLFPLLHMLTNVSVYYLSQQTITSQRVFSSLIIFDTLALSLSLILTGNTGSDLYLCYFLVIIIAAFWQDIRWSLTFALVISLIYGSFLFIAEQHDTELLLRVPFLFIASVFYGYFTQLIGYERSRRETAESEARKDSLTGLPNRKAFDEQIKLEEERARRYGRPLSLLMVDIDNFKAVNDSLGHQWGDTVLRVVARTIATSIRQTDFAARYGGEEFVLILPETQIEDAVRVGERIRIAIRENPVATPRGSLVTTVSIGASSNRTSDQSLDRDADQALYSAKRRGKDRVECFSDIAPTNLQLTSRRQ